MVFMFQQRDKIVAINDIQFAEMYIIHLLCRNITYISYYWMGASVSQDHPSITLDWDSFCLVA